MSKIRQFPFHPWNPCSRSCDATQASYDAYYFEIIPIVRSHSSTC